MTKLANRSLIVIALILAVLIICWAWQSKKELASPFAGDQTSTYVSEKLGVKFEYLDTVDDYRFTIEERGPEIQIVNLATGELLRPQAFLTVFSKEAEESFAQAIERVATGGKSLPAGCRVKLQEGIRGPATYQFLTIKSDFWPEDEFGNEAPCETVELSYVSDNSWNYFIYNPAVPTKFVYAFNGQDGFWARYDESGAEERIPASETVEIFR